MFKRIVNAVQLIALAATAVFVVLLFVDRAPGTKTVSATEPNLYETPASSGSSATTAPAAPGATVFAANCSTCHGSSGQGGLGPKLASASLKKQFADIRTQIDFVTQGSGAMPAFGNRLSAAEIRAVVEYTRSLN